jgi:hypothetical protein
MGISSMTGPPREELHDLRGTPSETTCSCRRRRHDAGARPGRTGARRHDAHAAGRAGSDDDSPCSSRGTDSPGHRSGVRGGHGPAPRTSTSRSGSRALATTAVSRRPTRPPPPSNLGAGTDAQQSVSARAATTQTAPSKREHLDPDRQPRRDGPVTQTIDANANAGAAPDPQYRPAPSSIRPSRPPRRRRKGRRLRRRRRPPTNPASSACGELELDAGLRR